MELVKINAEEYGIEESKAAEISAQFKPMLDKMVELEKEANEVYKMVDGPDKSKAAKVVRLKYVKVRTGTADIHKKQKAFYLAGGRYVDGWKSAQAFTSEGAEEKLSGIENRAATIEKERKAKLREERVEALLKYDANPEHTVVEDMETEVWNNYFQGVKLQHQQKIDAEKKAEEERKAKEKAEAEERERIAKENVRLKKEAEAKEMQLEKERAEAQKKQKEIEAKAKREREDAEKLRLKAEEKAKAEREAAEEVRKKEAEARVRAEEKLKQAKEAESKRLSEEESARQVELAKGDQARYDDLIQELTNISEKYAFKAAKYKNSFNGCKGLLAKVITYLESKK